MFKSKFDKLFNLIMEEYNSPKITAEIATVIINALNILWEYRNENQLFQSIEPQSPDDEKFDDNFPFENLTKMYAWDNAITDLENQGSHQLLVSPIHFYNAIVNAIINIDKEQKIIYIKPDVEFFADEEEDVKVGQALVDLKQDVNLNGYQFEFLTDTENNNEYDTQCYACGKQFCLNNAQYNDQTDSYLCPECGSPNLGDIEIN